MKFGGSYITRCRYHLHSINGGNRLFEIYPTLDSEWYPHYLTVIENRIASNVYSRL